MAGSGALHPRAGSQEQFHALCEYHGGHHGRKGFAGSKSRKGASFASGVEGAFEGNVG